ncbi:MAG: Universal stress protein family protein [Syntrophaceae bacterium PtaU1.Bin231]|nr:MAG: Universal stress protein family protein [Syntrophaceae bacterium PtaU1.Bin231]
MFKRILFPVDFSLHSSTIMGCLPYLKRAGMEEALLVHVIDPTEAVQWANLEEAIAARRKEAEEKMGRFVSDMQSHYEGIKGTIMTAIGLPYREILRIAEEQKASLIVMGSHGHSFGECAVLGSVTYNVMRQTRVPIVIAKIQWMEDGGEKKPVCMGMENIFRKVLYPTDFSGYSLSVLQLIEHWGSAGIEEVVIVHIQDTTTLFPHLQHKMGEFNAVDAERLEKMQARLERAGYRVKTILKTGVPFVEINRIADEENVSMIMLSSQGKSAIKEALMGSVSEAIARDHIRPVMIIPKTWTFSG